MNDNDRNPYWDEIERVLPRLLASYDRDPLSPTLGLGDRLHWAWKTADFANATPQGAVNGLSRLLAAGRLPMGLSRQSVIRRIGEMIRATGALSARDGSLVEAFPNEKSFCVTALVAFDILCAAEHLEAHVGRETVRSWHAVAAPLIEFLIENDETHAIISNHLATAVAALLRWTGPNAGRAEDRARHLLKRILDHQSPEGWFSEYGGPDPGYETLGLTYLGDVHLRRPDLGLKPHLERCLAFLGHWTHPDGSFGGLYGARNTRFIVPAGLEALGAQFPDAAALARFARRAIGEQRVVTLSALDDPNLAPMFNAYCWACCLAEPRAPDHVARLPHEDPSPWRRHFPAAKLVVDNGADHYTIVAAAKGGVVYHFPKSGLAPTIDAGAVARRRGRFYTTQAYRPHNHYVVEGDRIVVEAPFVETKSERPTPLKFLLLRGLSLTLFRSRTLLEIAKRLLVRRLITGQRPAGPVNRRAITLGSGIKVVDEVIPPGALEIIKVDGPFSAIHMASAGYWQRQDDAT